MRLPANTLVGRASELATLEVALDAAAGGTGGAVILTGEAGIGKSRLAREVSGRAVSAGMRVLRGRASAIGAVVPFRPLTELLLGLARSGGLPNAPDLGAYRRVLGRLIPEWRDQPGAPPDDSLVILAEAVLRLVSLAAADRGCMIVLEDLHDADAETLGVVEYLIDNLDRQPVLLVVTTRSEPGPAWNLIRAADQRGTGVVVNLRAFDGREVENLVAARLATPLDRVPEPVVDRVRRDCGGNPFLIEEVLADWLDSGALARDGTGWRVAGRLGGLVPTTLVRSVAERVDRLGSHGRALLCAASVFGHRFPLSIVQAITDIDEHGLVRHLHASFAAHLVVPDEHSTDWYAFRHALVADALLATLGPGRRRELAARAADEVQRQYPELPGDWCQAAARLRLHAGDAAAAGKLFAEAGRRAYADGAATSAVTLLERANECLAGSGDAAARGAVVELLLPALADAGHLERALAGARMLDGGGGCSLGARQRAAVHTHLAWAAATAGRTADSLVQVEAARRLTDPADEEATAGIDLVEAELTIYSGAADGLTVAEDLARRALDAASRVSLPVTACRALELLGTLSRRYSFAESAGYFERLAALANQHELQIWRLRALAMLGANDVLREGSADRLWQARAEVVRAGAVVVGYRVDLGMAFQAVLSGDYRLAGELIDGCVEPVRRLGLTDIAQYAVVARAALAAHQGRRPEMEADLREFRRLDGDQTPYTSMASGLCEAVCALLEEDRDAGYAALIKATDYEDGHPTVFHLSGRHGLMLLLRALHEELTPEERAASAATMSGQLRWNRQFGLLADAVLRGRRGDRAGAAAQVRAATEAGSVFTMARHLGLRLVAEAAVADGWGEPVEWLREAENHFHGVEVPAVASACRGLLRRAGATVPQRRSGHERLPEQLRRLGITIREYEVMRLLVKRLANKEIGARLHISPRTVEKHIASLLVKTSMTDRAALSGYAADICGH